MEKVIIEKKIDSIFKCLDRVSSKLPKTKEVFFQDLDAQDIIVLNITRSIQLSVDIAMHLCVESNQPVPQTMADAFECINHLKVIDIHTTNSMKKSVGYRNMAIHTYDNIDLELTYTIAENFMTDFTTYIKQIVKYLR